MWSPNELLKTEKQRDILSYITLQFFPFKKVPLEHYPNVGRSEPLSHGCAVPAPRFGEPSPLSEIFLASPRQGRMVLPQGFII